MREFSSSVLRAGELLDVVIHAPTAHGLKLTDIARGRPYSRTTTYRLLQSLIQLGLIAQTAEYRYVRGPVMMEYALRIGRDEKWLQRARLLLQRIQRRTGEAAALSLVMSGTERLFLEQVQDDAMPAGMTTMGARVPLDTGASGIAILSRLPAEELDHYLKLRRRERSDDPAEEAALLERIAEARRRGYASSHGEYSPIGAATAVPVVVPPNTVIGALSVKLPAERLSSRQIFEHAAILKSAACELSAILVEDLVNVPRAS